MNRKRFILLMAAAASTGVSAVAQSQSSANAAATLDLETGAIVQGQSSASAAAVLDVASSATAQTQSSATAAATLRLETPGQSQTQSSATAAADLANVYQIFTAPTQDADGTLHSVAGVGTSTITLDGFVADWSGYVWLVAVSKCGVHQTDPLIKKRLAFDGNANLIGDTPLPPVSVDLVPTANGYLTVDWSFIERRSNTNPTVFNIYLTTFDLPFDFSTPSAVVAASGVRDYSHSIGPYATGTLVRAVVRPQAASGAENANTIMAEAIADATAPAVPSSVTVEVTP